MKNIFLLELLVLMLFATVGQAQVRRFGDFWDALAAYQRSGGQDEALQKKMCGLGVSALNEMRTEVLRRFPALQTRKKDADLQLQQVSLELQEAKKNGRNKQRIKFLETEIKRISLELGALEDELEAQLHADDNLGGLFNMIQKEMIEWCD